MINMNEYDLIGRKICIHLGIHVDAVNVVGLEVEHHEELKDARVLVEEVGEGHGEVRAVLGPLGIPVQEGRRLEDGEVEGAVTGALNDLLGAQELAEGGVQLGLVCLAFFGEDGDDGTAMSLVALTLPAHSRPVVSSSRISFQPLSSSCRTEAGVGGGEMDR